MKTIFEKSRPGRATSYFAAPAPGEKAAAEILPAAALRSKPPGLPEVSELEVVRHFTELSHRMFSIDGNFYPLGSCTMKYNPRINERVAGLPGFAKLHPAQPESTAQGILELMWSLERMLAEIAGMDAVTLQPAAGAQGELTGILLIRAYHTERGQAQRREVLIPDSAHGTNPATSTQAGYKTVNLKSNKRGGVDLDDLKAKLSDRTAALMITNPSTLGLFEEDIQEIARLVHEAGGLVYMDGANMNAIQGKARPGDFGIDVMHFNLHKTFSTPHGGGGPGSGPVACKKLLEPYLPLPRVVREESRFRFDANRPKSIGRVKSFWGNVGMHIRAYTYIRYHGAEGLRRNAEQAVLNANYLLSRLRGHFKVAYDRPCMHEFVLDGTPLLKKTGVRTLDVAKRLLDYGMHPPTIYFPLIVHEALMIEPTETENRETLDAFADALLKIAEEARTDPEKVKTAPHTMPVKRLNEVKAAKEPVVRC
ncbi:MAG TPA: aminomethyl-transferring glycine dehydrogenase subunit GcvPB, partial [Planctomycetota bacterium]|nr:aminomethyl-transferring glycine dehydrogenase subunit GcvPB [Planctomycetota bacterium]